MSTDLINILFTGDFCPINRIEELAMKKDYALIFNDFIDVFQGNDINVIDLECPLTISKSARRKTGPHQKAHPDNIHILNYAGIKLAALSNNHIMDFSSEGVRDTLEICKENGIDTIGISEAFNEPFKPYSAKIKGKKIAIFNYADEEFLTTPDGSIRCNPIDSIQCFYDLHNVRKSHDFVIVIIHAGNEFYELPSPRTKRLYRSIIDMGADVIISHHTHVFSGYEIYKSKPIFYGLGNFIYDWPGNINSRWNQGFVVNLQIS